MWSWRNQRWKWVHVKRNVGGILCLLSGSVSLLPHISQMNTWSQQKASKTTGLKNIRNLLSSSFSLISYLSESGSGFVRALKLWTHFTADLSEFNCGFYLRYDERHPRQQVGNTSNTSNTSNNPNNSRSTNNTCHTSDKSKNKVVLILLILLFLLLSLVLLVLLFFTFITCTTLIICISRIIQVMQDAFVSRWVM